MSELRICVIDLETTHIKPHLGQILEVALLPLFKPSTEILTRLYHTSLPSDQTEGAIKVNGLTEEVIAERRLIRQENYRLVPGFFSLDIKFWQQAFDQYDVIVAHCISFDAGWLMHHGVNLDGKTFICTEKLLQHLHPQKSWWSLKKGCELYGVHVDTKRQHGAEYDAQLCYRLYLKLCTQIVAHNYNDNIKPIEVRNDNA